MKTGICFLLLTLCAVAYSKPAGSGEVEKRGLLFGGDSLLGGIIHSAGNLVGGALENVGGALGEVGGALGNIAGGTLNAVGNVVEGVEDALVGAPPPQVAYQRVGYAPQGQVGYQVYGKK